MSARKPVVRDILSYFPAKHSPRRVQADALKAIEANWNHTDVFCVNVPVAGGKSDLGYCITKFAKNSLILTPSRILVDQYLEDFNNLPHLKAKDDYLCDECRTLGAASCYDAARLRGSRTKPLYSASCLYPQHVKRARVVPYLLCNYHVAMAHKIHRNTLVLDESHNMIPFIQDLAAKTLWQHKWHYPSGIQTHADLLSWLLTLPRNEAVQELVDILQDTCQRYTLERTQAEYGRSDKDGVRTELDCIKLKPIDIRDYPPVLWPKAQTKKIILMSATIGTMDVEALGLSRERGYRVTYIEAESPIPAANRPVVLDCSASMSYAAQDRNLHLLAAYVKRIKDRHGTENGVVHLTYGLAHKLRKILDSSDFMWHTKENRSKVYEEFRSLPPNSSKVLFACGLYEGIDLKEDIARWQILAKIPWPSLADSAVRYMAQTNERWLAWETLKVVLQFSGRVCRTPTDTGTSYVFDSSYYRLEELASDLMPKWFTDALVKEE